MEIDALKIPQLLSKINMIIFIKLGKGYLLIGQKWIASSHSALSKNTKKEWTFDFPPLKDFPGPINYTIYWHEFNVLSINLMPELNRNCNVVMRWWLDWYIKCLELWWGVEVLKVDSFKATSTTHLTVELGVHIISFDGTCFWVNSLAILLLNCLM